jgi:hypothetical protein
MELVLLRVCVSSATRINISSRVGTFSPHVYSVCLETEINPYSFAGIQTYDINQHTMSTKAFLFSMKQAHAGLRHCSAETLCFCLTYHFKLNSSLQFENVLFINLSASKHLPFN